MNSNQTVRSNELHIGYTSLLRLECQRKNESIHLEDLRKRASKPISKKDPKQSLRLEDKRQLESQRIPNENEAQEKFVVRRHVTTSIINRSEVDTYETIYGDE